MANDRRSPRANRSAGQRLASAARREEVRWLIMTDVHRIAGRSRPRDVVRQLILGETFPYVFWMRACQYLAELPVPARALVLPARLILRRLRYRMGINIPWRTRVGPGLLLGHAGGIVISANAVIGADCNINHNVTIGANKGNRSGCPTLGNRVYVGPGAVVIGNISIGDDVAIGANAVVVDDVAPGVTVAGIPARVVSANGSRGWINRTDYPPRRRLGTDRL